MKKAQKDSVKKGGEMARKLYSAFMAEPQWMTHILKDELIKGLRRYIEYESAMREEIVASMNNLRKASNMAEKSVKELKAMCVLAEEAYNSGSGLMEARKLLQLFEGTNPFYEAPSIVHHDLSTISRLN